MNLSVLKVIYIHMMWPRRKAHFNAYLVSCAACLISNSNQFLVLKKNLAPRLNSLGVRQWTKVPLKTTSEVMEDLRQDLQLGFILLVTWNLTPIT